MVVMTFWRVCYLTLKTKCEVSFSDLWQELRGKAFVENCCKRQIIRPQPLSWNLILKFCAVECRFMIYFEAGREREPQTWRCRIVRWIRRPSRTGETSYFVEIEKDLFFEAFHHYNNKKVLKNYTKSMVNSLTVWFVAGRGRNRRIWR